MIATDVLKKTADTYNHSASITDAALKLGMARSSVRDRLRQAEKIGIAVKWHNAVPLAKAEVPDEPKTTSVDVPSAERIVVREPGHKYLITSAQNATPVLKPFWDSLNVYARYHGAEIMVIPLRYKNPTSVWTESQKNAEWWSPCVAKHLVTDRVSIAPGCVVLGDVKICPTRIDPLMRLESVSGRRSAIIGSPKLAFKTVPTPQSALPKIMTTTGSCTDRNYTNSGTEVHAAFHHTFGAAIVDVQPNGHYHIRHINAHDGGSFVDLGTEYNHAGMRSSATTALVMGDLHYPFIDPGVDVATFGVGGIVDTLRPEYIFIHDAIDFYCRNHHNRGDWVFRTANHEAGKDSVLAEIRGFCEWLEGRVSSDQKIVIVPSNHPDALMRWIKETVPQDDPENAGFWLETSKMILEGTVRDDGGVVQPDPFALWCKRLMEHPERVTFLRRGESFVLHDVEFQYHSDRGPNGARGNSRNMSRLGIKTMFAHGHAPEIFEGGIRVGVSCRLNPAYISGSASGWLHSHGVLYENGKRDLINIIDGEWHG